LDSEIATMINGVRALLSAQGAECVDLDIPLLEHILPIYYTLMPAEVASNLARFDGIRF
jgi:aspartyl-tRNA(Asn)/glutamyl-tRNA(Gln) amidotransferase subunit A